MPFFETEHEFRHRPKGAPFDEREYRIEFVDSHNGLEKSIMALTDALGLGRDAQPTGELGQLEDRLSTTYLLVAQAKGPSGWYPAFGGGEHAVDINLSDNLRAVYGFPNEPNEFGAELVLAEYDDREVGIRATLGFFKTYSPSDKSRAEFGVSGGGNLERIHHSSIAQIMLRAGQLPSVFIEGSDLLPDTQTTPGGMSQVVTAPNAHGADEWGVYASFILDTNVKLEQCPLHVFAARLIVREMMRAADISGAMLG